MNRSRQRTTRLQRTLAPAAAILLEAASTLGLPAPLTAQELILTNANVVDVVTGVVESGMTIVVSGGRILAVQRSPGEIPAGVTTIDLGGRYVAPGLMDAHVHIASLDQARRALTSGVTTARSMGVSNYADVGLARIAASGAVQLPEIIPAGYHIRPQPAEDFFFQHPELARYMGGKMTGAEAVRSMVRAQLGRGVAFIKTNATERAGLPETDPRKQLYGEAELRVMVEEANARNVGVAAHAHGDAGGRAAVLAGVRSIEHGTYLSPGTLDLMAERGTYLAPTIAIVADLTQPGGDYDDAQLLVRGRTMLPRVREMAAAAKRAGVKIVAATDTGYGPESTTRLGHELEEFVGIGMTPLEALQAATLTAAELFGIENRTGRIAPGLEADLIVLERNPLEDVRVLQDVLMVINNGEVAARKGDWPERRTD